MDRNDLPAISPGSASPEVKPVTKLVLPAPTPVHAPAPKPAPAVVSKPPLPVPTRVDEDDGEKLIREFTERQKIKMARLEQQVTELGKVTAERDSAKGRIDAIGKELLGTRKELENALKNVELAKDLKHKLDAAMISNSMLSAENAKFQARTKDLEARVRDLEASLKRHQEKSAEAESRIQAALHALQPKPATPAPAPVPVAAAPVAAALAKLSAAVKK